MKPDAEIPKTLDEAIDILFNSLKEEDIEYIKTHTSYSIHFCGGMGIRNNWDLWNTQSDLNKDIQQRFGLFGHGDDCSGLIWRGVWAKVRGLDINDVLEDTAQGYIEHWKNMGLDAKTGEEVGKAKYNNVGYKYKYDF